MAIGASDYTALAEQFPFKITAEAKGDKAEIRISGVIHQWSNSAEWFRRQIESFNEQGIKNASLYINTPGGDVFQAAEIRNELDAFEGDVIGYGGAMVASAGTYIRLGCKTFDMVPNGQWMYHKPQGALRGNENDWESKLQLLKNITSEYRKAYAELTGNSEEEIEKKWSKGDVWLNAEQALEQKFITGISKYKVKITEKETAMFTACGVPNPPKPTKSKPKLNNEMDLKVTALTLGLDENATEAEVKAEMANLRAKAAKADTLEKTAKDKETATRTTEIKAILDKANTDKKITAKSRESLEKWANADFEGFKAHVENLPVPGKISEQIAGKSAGASAATAKEKSFEDMTAEESDLLEEEDPAAFQAKYEAYLNK
jgi:ATP-dependent protease ClpP protease subunit